MTRLAAHIRIRLYCLKQLLSLLLPYACVNAGLPWRSDGSFGGSFLTSHLEAGAPPFLLPFCILQPSWPETFSSASHLTNAELGLQMHATALGFYVGTRDGTQITRLGSKALCSLSHLSGPRLYSSLEWFISIAIYHPAKCLWRQWWLYWLEVSDRSGFGHWNLCGRAIVHQCYNVTCSFKQLH